MAIGYPPSKDGLNQRLGQIASSIAAIFEDINVLITWAAQNNDAALTALGLSTQDIADFRAYVADAANWRDTTYGQRAQTPATNFMFNVGKARIYI